MLAALLEDNEARCNPPLDEAEVETIAHSAARHDPQLAETQEGHLTNRRWQRAAFRAGLGHFVALRSGMEKVAGLGRQALGPRRDEPGHGVREADCPQHLPRRGQDQ